MNWKQIAALSTLTILTQSCEKTRATLSDKVGRALDSTRNAVGKEPSSTDLNDTNFDSFTHQRDHLVVVTFTADWCGPCRKLAPAMEKVASEFGDSLKTGRVDVDRNRQLATRSGVSGIPDVRFFHNGRQVHRFTGARSQAQLRELFQEHIDEIENGTLATPTISAELQPLARDLRDVTRDLHPRALPQPPKDEDRETRGEEEAAPEPTIRPMEKNWIPPGIQRR